MLRIIVILFVMLSFSTLSQREKRTIHEFQSNDSTLFQHEVQLRYIGSSTEIDMNYRYVLEHLVEQLQKNPSWKIHVRGHVCCGPSEKISEKRAKKVYQFLISQGVSEERVTFKGYSDTKPYVTPEKKEEDQALNRRVDFIISTK